MTDNIDKCIRNLEEILRKNNTVIKQEPVDEDEVEVEVIQENSQSSRRDPRLHNNNYNNSNIYEGMRKNFLEKNLNIHDVLNRITPNASYKNKVHERVKNTYERAKTVYRKAFDENCEIFYGHISVNPHEYSHLQHQHHVSPVTQNLYSPIFPFQTVSETARNVSKNPYSEITFATQKLSRKIGADLDEIIKQKKRKTQATRSQEPLTITVETTPVQNIPPPAISQLTFQSSSSNVNKEDKSFQTGNTGSFILEIPCEEMVNLTDEQINLITQVTRTFNVKISTKSTDMLERIKFRQQTLKNHEPHRSRSVNNRRSGPPM